MKNLLHKHIFASIIGLHINLLLLSQPMSVGVGTGVSAYYGDLIYTQALFQQVSPSISTDLTVDFNSRFRARLNVAFIQLGADDKKSIYWPTRNRNLNFKTDVFELSTLAEFDLFNEENVLVTPYIFAGPGVFLFNPTTVDRYGNKVSLKYVGTEGQPGSVGQAGAASNLPADIKSSVINQFSKAYKTNELCLISGLGLRVRVSDFFSVGAEISYRFTNTDMLDDVSAKQYPDKNSMSPYAYKLTFREDEIRPNAVPGFQPRGNPLKNDGYYSVQIRVSYRLN